MKLQWRKEEHHDGELPAWWRDDLPWGVVVRERTRTVSEPLGPDMESPTGEWVYSPARVDDGLPAGPGTEYEEYTSLEAAQARCEELARG